MKKIAYVELDTHAEIALNFRDLMQDCNEFEVDYYFSERIFRLLGNKESNIFLSSSTTLLHQLSAQNYDLIILGTVHRNFNLYKAISKNFNSAIIVHNLNFIKISKFQLFRNIFKKDLMFRLKLWLKEDLLAAPDVFNNVRNKLVLDESLASKQFKFLPLFFSKDDVQSAHSTINIVIPGSVEQSRRHYKMIFDKIKAFRRTTPFKFIFLGKAKGEELMWLQDLEGEKTETIEIKYFTEKVPQAEFDLIMQNTDVLWCPIQRETEFFSNKEIYGKTKMSGNIGDAIKYGKPAIFPRNYASKHPFLIPQEEDVEAQILNIVKDFAYDFQAQFRRKKIRRELEKVLHSLV